MEVLKLETWINEFGQESINPSKLQEYLDFITEAQDRYDPERYSEWHHVMPKCIDSRKRFRDQGVQINGRDHFLAHRKLVDCFISFGKVRALTCALMRMSKSKSLDDVTPEEYEEARELFSQTQKGEGNNFYSKHHSDSFKEDMSHAQSGRILVTNGSETRRVKDESQIPEGWRRGVKDSTKEAFSRRTDNHLEGMIRITNGTEETMIPEGTPVPEGWRRGRVSFTEDHRKNLRESLKDRMYITDGLRNRKIPKSSPVPEGWYKGFTKRKRDVSNEIC